MPDQSNQSTLSRILSTGCLLVGLCDCVGGEKTVNVNVGKIACKCVSVMEDAEKDFEIVWQEYEIQWHFKIKLE